MPEIGFLNSGTKAEFAHLFAAFRDGLKLNGYKVVGSASKGPKDVRVHTEWANGDYSQLPAKAKSLIDKRVNVIVATGGIGAARAASTIGSQIPLLFASGRKAPAHGDPTTNAKAVYLGMSTANVEDHPPYNPLRDLLGHDAHIYP